MIDLSNLGWLIIITLMVISICLSIEMLKDGSPFVLHKECELGDDNIPKIKENIMKMEGREFEIFCARLFEETGKYKSVELTPPQYDGGKDIILDGKIYVECKRYTDGATKTEEYMIGREICQKLVGAIVAEGLKQGIIITTGNIHQNAWDYIIKLEKKSDIRIEIMDIDDIMNMVKSINTTEVLGWVGLAKN